MWRDISHLCWLNCGEGGRETQISALGIDCVSGCLSEQPIIRPLSTVRRRFRIVKLVCITLYGSIMNILPDPTVSQIENRGNHSSVCSVSKNNVWVSKRHIIMSC
jgi:hypothetical protein